MTVHLSLTRAPHDVVRELMADGATNRQIGERLYVTEDTVKTHIKTLMRLSGCTQRTEFVVKVFRRQVVIHAGDRTYVMHNVPEPLEAEEVA